MSPAEDAALLLRIVRRHLQAMRLNLDPLYPDEEWGFQAQQALEKLLKAQLVLCDQPAPRTHELLDLALLLNEQLPASRVLLLDDWETRLKALESTIEGSITPPNAGSQELPPG